MNNLFGKFDFGEVKAKMSHLGIAVARGDRYVAYDKNKEEIVDVTPINFSGLAFKLPVAIKNIENGDVIIHNNKLMVVAGKETEDNIIAIDIKEGEKVTILPTKSVFGFNFITKVVTMFDFIKQEASEEQPFGNMLPFLLMSNNAEGSIKDMMLPLMMMNGGDMGSFDMLNPLMLMALMGGGSESKDFFLMMMLMNQK